MKDEEEFYGFTDDDIINFVEACKSENDNFLHIKTQALADTFVLLCKKFHGASIMAFIFESGTNSPRRLFRYKNDLYLKIGVHVFLPGLRYGETYIYDITLFFKEISELSYIPTDINTNTEIELDSFTVSQDECCFSCFLKNDHTRKFIVKAKEILVEDYISVEDDEDEDESDDTNHIENYNEKSNQPLSTMEEANLLYNRKQYKDCIHLLEYEYYDLEKDAEANHLLALCYSKFKNFNEAIRYVNKAIGLNSKEASYYYYKGLYLCNMRLPIDGIKCLNTALKYEENERYNRKISNTIIDIVKAIMADFYILSISDNEKFSDHMIICDSIINLQYCFPELKEKYKKLKKEIIDYYFNQTNFKSELPNMDFKMLASRYEALLQIKDLPDEQRSKIESRFKDCNEAVISNERFEKEKAKEEKYINDLIARGFSYQEIAEAFKNKFPESYFSSYSVKSKIENYMHKKTNINASSSERVSKKDTIRSMMEMEMSKSEIIEQLSAEYGISEESARASINSYCKDDSLGLKEYFENNDFDDEDDYDDIEDDYDDESWS